MDSVVKEEHPQENQEKEATASLFAERSEGILADDTPFLSSQSEWWLKFLLGVSSTLLVVGGVAWWRRK